MKREFEMVKEFHEIFGHPFKNNPTKLTADRVEARANWIKEEVDEFVNAQTIYDQADALIDAIYFCLGGFVELGINPEPVFDIVQKANMSKLWADGKPHYRESDGKVAKPKGWQAPEPQIEAEIKRQMK